MSAEQPQLVIYGAWYFGRVIAEAAEALGWEVLGYVDPDPPQDIVTLGSVPSGAAVFAAIGDNAIRAAVNASLLEHGRNLASIVHPAASVSPSARLGPGTYVAELAAVRTMQVLAKGWSCRRAVLSVMTAGSNPMRRWARTPLLPAKSLLAGAPWSAPVLLSHRPW